MGGCLGLERECRVGGIRSNGGESIISADRVVPPVYNRYELLGLTFRVEYGAIPSSISLGTRIRRYLIMIMRTSLR